MVATVFWNESLEENYVYYTVVGFSYIISLPAIIGIRDYDYCLYEPAAPEEPVLCVRDTPPLQLSVPPPSVALEGSSAVFLQENK